MMVSCCLALLALGQAVRSNPTVQLVNATNAVRKEQRIPALTTDPRLMRAAQFIADEVARTGKLSHTDTKGDGPAERALAAGYRYRWVAENLALGQRDPDEAVRSWMKSQGHRENILATEPIHLGVGVARDAKGRRIWAQVFAAPR